MSPAVGMYRPRLRRRDRHPEVMAMDGPQTRSEALPPILNLERDCEPTRLQPQWLAAAYEQLCPLRRAALGNPDGGRSRSHLPGAPLAQPLRMAAQG